MCRGASPTCGGILIYLGDFAESGTENFVNHYYAQSDKDGLAFDERWNTGGFTSQWVISVLRRRAEGIFVNREGGVTQLQVASHLLRWRR